MKSLNEFPYSGTKVPKLKSPENNPYEIGLLLESIQQELNRSYTYEKSFHSLHESESVIREEIEEVTEELDKINKSFDDLHQAMRNDDVESYMEVLGYLRQYSWNLLQESVQVVAMAEKSLNSFKDES